MGSYVSVLNIVRAILVPMQILVGCVHPAPRDVANQRRPDFALPSPKVRLESMAIPAGVSPSSFARAQSETSR